MWNPIFPSMLDSSIWLEKYHVRIVWVTLLAAKDEFGFAHFSAIQNLANRSNVTLEEAQEAEKILMSPDPNSGDDENDGRRIEKVPGGYYILNSEKYQQAMQSEVRKKSGRERVARMREKRKAEEDAKQPQLSGLEEKTPKPVKRTKREDAVAILKILNEHCGKTFREVDSNITLISCRMNEDGVDFEGVKQMVIRQCALWRNDANMSHYLRPETLFRKSKFDSYYASRQLPIQNARPNGSRPNPRNEGLVKCASNDYAAAGKRRAAATAERAKQIAQAHAHEERVDSPEPESGSDASSIPYSGY